MGASTLIKHTDGKRGGYLIGRPHSQDGIKAVNIDNGQPIEMEGNEAVITAPAVEDKTLHNFNGRKMTNRQILSAINESGGGVAFAEGGTIPDKINVTKREHRYNGKVMTEASIVHSCGCKHSMEEGGTAANDSQDGKDYFQQQITGLLAALPFLPMEERETVIKRVNILKALQKFAYGIQAKAADGD